MDNSEMVSTEDSVIKGLLENDIRIIGLDLDNTTLNSEKEVSKATQEAFSQAMAKGIEVVIATGRVFSALPKVMTGIEGIEYAICSNGASIIRLCDNEIIYKNYIKTEAAVELLDFIKKEKLLVEVFSEGRAYIDDWIYRDIEKNSHAYRYADYILRSRMPVKSVYEIFEEKKDRIENISINFHDMQRRSDILSSLQGFKDVTVTTSLPYNIEIGGNSTSKAEALSELIRQRGLTRQNLMTCGDSMNDAEMIRYAGVGVVVANAEDDMKEIADYVTDTNDNDGVAKAIHLFALKDLDGAETN